MEAAGIFETLLTYQAIQCHILGDNNLNIHPVNTSNRIFLIINYNFFEVDRNGFHPNAAGVAEGPVRPVVLTSVSY
jgi:hypothetical protein